MNEILNKRVGFQCDGYCPAALWFETGKVVSIQKELTVFVADKLFCENVRLNILCFFGGLPSMASNVAIPCTLHGLWR